MSAPTMRIDSADFYMRNVHTRMPFKYGVAVLTSVPILHTIVNVTVEGKRVQGIAADILPPKWFDKDPEKNSGQLFRSLWEGCDSFEAMRND